jgi:hypothetical protein
MSDPLEEMRELEDWTDEQLEDLQLLYLKGTPDDPGVSPIGSVMDLPKDKSYHPIK